jgi:hypothetical protein
MNCQEVETMITDLARHSALEAAAREGALAHLDHCRRCSERLAEEKRLSGGLAAWDAALLNEQAPPALEAKLRAAFREQKAAPAQAPGRRWLGIGAVGAIAAAVLLFKLLTPPPAPRVAPVAQVPPLPPATASVSQVLRPEDDPPAQPAKRKRQATRLPHMPPPVPAELGTEFLPVAQGDGWTPLEGGRLVRVRLPRSAMGAFGFPVDEERAPERVQADVMLSNDGLLRAIRFVR